MNFSKFAKFRTVGKKPTIQKFPAQKTPKIQDQYLKLIQKSQQNKNIRSVLGKDTNPTRLPLVSLEQERITNIAGKVEKRALRKNLNKVRAAAKRTFPKNFKFKERKIATFENKIQGPFLRGSNQDRSIKKFQTFKTSEGKKALFKIDKAKTQAVKTARVKGLKFYNKASEKRGFGTRNFRKLQTPISTRGERKMASINKSETRIKEGYGTMPSFLRRSKQEYKDSASYIPSNLSSSKYIYLGKKRVKRVDMETRDFIKFTKTGNFKRKNIKNS
jgi:hypothetical protein|tara:strand:- start:97 stop:918 length:822 start_codon:yes stop_codon:yes gene_type:complete